MTSSSLQGDDDDVIKHCCTHMLSLAALNLRDLCWFILAQGACQQTEEDERFWFTVNGSQVALFLVPCPAFCRLQYGKAGRAWYIF